MHLKKTGTERKRKRMMRVILASGSPRRREMLDAVGLRFEVIASAVAELEHDENGSPGETVVCNAVEKARDVARRIDGDALVVGADTLVFVGGRALGKPASLDDARAMLRTLSGVTHQVYTGVAVVRSRDGWEGTGHEVTDVTFRDLSTEDIDSYLARVDPHDRAGAYTVDGPGSLLVARFDGCFYNVLGLPMVLLDTLLRRFGLSLLENISTP